MTKGQFLQKEYTLPRGNLTRSWSLLAVAVLLGVLCSTSLSLAARDQNYQALRHWLERYRTAQPTFKPGEHLALKDRGALKPFIPQPAWAYYFFSDMDMEIAPTGHYPLPPGWGKEVKPGYHLDEQGVLVGFTGGGFPFPTIDPEDLQAAVKVVWNLLWRPGGKDYVMPMVTWSRGEGGRLDRRLQFIETSARYARGDHCLVPGYGEVWNKTLLELRAPRDLAGTKRLIINYLDHYQEDDGWIYMPSQRKPRRVLASERTDEFPGMDNVPEDLWGFDGKVYEHHWTYLGKKAVLATINVRDNPEPGGPHLWVPDKARWEVRECHVLLVGWSLYFATN